MSRSSHRKPLPPSQHEFDKAVIIVVTHLSTFAVRVWAMSDLRSEIESASHSRELL